MYEGTITKIVADKGFGFIALQDSDDVFFHRSALKDLAFNEQLVEMRVKFEIVDAPRGPRASNIRAAA